MDDPGDFFRRSHLLSSKHANSQPDKSTPPTSGGPALPSTHPLRTDMFAMFRQPLDVLLSPLLLASLFLGLSLADRTVSDGVPGPSSSTELRPFPRSGIGSSFSYKATEPIPLSQNILYIVGTFLVVGGLVLRFLSYRGDSSDEPRRSRRIGDAAIVIAVVTYLTVSALQFFLLTEEHALADHIDPVYGAHFGMTVDMRVRKGQVSASG